MKKEIILASSLLLGLALIITPPAEARRHHTASGKYTVTDRQATLTKEIDAAYSANQLTLKEADDLKAKLSSIKTKEQQMKDKNGGKLSYADNNSLEKSLNNISNKLHKKILEKRVK
jgi:hypothetical protein